MYFCDEFPVCLISTNIILNIHHKQEAPDHKQEAPDHEQEAPDHKQEAPDHEQITNVERLCD